MLTQNEITALSLSPTKKDFVQIWNELLEVAGKLSERWDPTSTNESDPGIVILKALAGIADKLNYNIDKNILEAFMPTAAQEDSMRKLCDMLGYNMKYYRSAEVDVKIKYHNSDPSDEEAIAMAAPGQLIPKFTVITNSDQDISYFTLERDYNDLSKKTDTGYYLTSEGDGITIHCMEGQIVKCESNADNNVITASQIQENNRFYLPETQIAENGIFIYNVTSTAGGNLVDGEKWLKVDNLNAQPRNTRVFKFGFDSYESRPYVEFPEGYSKLFNEGIFLYYARTSGINGNISPKTLTQIELPTTGSWGDVSAESISVENIFSATSGANAETIKQAYNNFKKTIGTFETLVTCRDYMNKIYSFIENGKPIVSNILVTDIRNDLNRAVQICSCDTSGIFYKDTPRTKTVTRKLKKSNSDEMVEVEDTESLINHFDLVLYPFKSYSQVRSNIKSIRNVYDSSFNYEKDAIRTITGRLEAEETQTISHNFKEPDIGDVISINNYLRLNVTVATNYKVTTDEGSIIIDNIKMALANAFNMRELDFGDEIPFDSIVDIIESADTRIKVASLNEPALYTTFSVLEEAPNGTPTVTEYAVASEWLDAENAEKTGRLTKTVMVTTEDDKKVERSVSTFDTKEAREIYNKLAVRNLLAGRVSLFNYNNTFKASFSEGAYQVTTRIDEKEKPAGLAVPNAEDPYTIWATGGATYTGQLDQDGNSTYTKTAPVYTDNIIAEDKSDDGAITNYITGISANCKLLADNAGLVTDVTLDSGEFVKFRAPNFTTIKTYPAYVNYHLDLLGGEAAQARPAVAESLFNILNSDLGSWSSEAPRIRWQKVHDYFGSLNNLGTVKDSYKKKFTIKQLVSAHKVAENDFDITSSNLETTISVGLNNTPIESTEYTAEALFALSGCVKLINDNFTARVEWTPQDGDEKLTGDVPLKIVLGDFTNPFITDISVLSSLKSQLDAALSTYKNSLPVECTKCSFTVYLDFECVPFEAKSLKVWEAFIEKCASELSNEKYEYQVLDFTPNADNNTVLWRLFGDGYDVGKYVTQNTEKLLKFDASYFGLLPSTYLTGIYLISDPGADMEPVIIKNNEEYMLRSGEYLYIEYTPSTTTEDGSTADNTAVTEIYGSGTIIRPSGFETGLMDSEIYARSVTPHKNVTFSNEGTGLTKAMHRFGASEQVEIRDFSKVTLSKDTFSSIYVYKNFNGCPELENDQYNSGAARKYTLKDGEAIFYTDHNQAEFAYFTSGTEVILEGNAKIGEFDIIELSAIFESGPQVIPWRKLTFEENADAITFQEYQYITLGDGDTVDSMLILDADTEKNSSGENVAYLSSDWKFCSDVEYTLASDPETKLTLPTINLHGDRDGNGWEASSILELDVSSSTAQTLRNTDKVATSLELLRTKTTGGPAGQTTISAKTNNTDISEQPMLFKTNLACMACGSKINIDDVLTNPDKVKGFQLKVFTKDEPTIVQTKPGKVIPYNYTGALTDWTGESGAIKKEYLDFWNQVNLTELSVADTGKAYDNALRLSVSLLPNTYGVFCIYLDYTNSDPSTVSTWIEVVPGTSASDVSLLNVKNAVMSYMDADAKNLSRLYLNPGINCVRVNKSDRIFIKTSANSKGMLYFDELQLVNSLPIKYTDSDNTTITTNTNGLNLAQLGYLRTSDSNTLSPTVREKLQEGYVNEMYSEINKRISDTDTKFAAYYQELFEMLPEVRKLVENEKLVEADLTAISELDDDRLNKLVERYVSLKDTLTKEKKLLDAFNNNTATDELKQNLVKLLDSFTSTDAAKQQILEDLEVLQANAESRVKNLSDKAILDDFETCSSKNSALSKVKAIVAESIENHYHECLTIVSGNLDKIVNSAGKSTLQTILTNLKTVVTKDAREALLTKIAELRSIVETDVSGILESLVEAANVNPPDYVRLLSLLTQLRNTVDSNTISTLVEDIAQAAEESNYKQVVLLLEALSSAIARSKDASSVSSVTDPNKLNEGASVIKYIDDVYSIIKNASSTGEDSASISKVCTAVDKLKNKISKDYIDNLTKILAAVQQDDKESTITILERLFASSKSIDEILEKLAFTEFTDKNEDSQVQLIITQLNNVIDERNKFVNGTIDNATVAGLNSFEDFDSWKSNTCAEFIRNAILSVWPDFISERLSAKLNEVYHYFTDTLLTGAFEEYKIKLTTVFSAETPIMRLALGEFDVYELFAKVKPILNTNNQLSLDSELIKEVSKLVRDSDELYAAIEDISSDNENVVVEALLTDYLANSGGGHKNDIKYELELQETLKAALGNAIYVNGQLFEVVAKLLCPNITKLLAELDPENDFYKKLLGKLSELETDIINGNANFDIAVDSDYVALLELPFADFKSKLATFEFSADTLAPDAIINIIMAMRDANDTTIRLTECTEELKKHPLAKLSSVDIDMLSMVNSIAVQYLATLRDKVEKLEETTMVEPEYEEAFNILDLEQQLLDEIRAIDVNRDFFYNVPIMDSRAIELNESVSSHNTLMNPRTNYDINNVNNSFVISKLDIDFLDSGIKIARSSRLN